MPVDSNPLPFARTAALLAALTAAPSAMAVDLVVNPPNTYTVTGNESYDNVLVNAGFNGTARLEVTDGAVLTSNTALVVPARYFRT